MKLIKNGTIITDGKRFQADIAIENGKITQIGQGIEGADEVRLSPRWNRISQCTRLTDICKKPNILSFQNGKITLWILTRLLKPAKIIK